MARLMEGDLRPLERLERLLVGMRDELLQRPLHVLGRVERLGLGRGAAPVVAVHELRVLDLDVGRVQQHRAAEIGRGRGGVDRSVESLLAEERDRPRVVDVSV